MARRRSDLCLGWLALALLASCTAKRSEPAAPPLALEHDGCVQVAAGGVCELSESARELVLWIASGEPAVQIDGRSITPARRTQLEQGTQLRIHVPPGARTLSVRSAGRKAQLHIAQSPYPPSFDAIRGLFAEGKLDEFVAALDRLERELSPDRECQRGRLLSFRVRARLAQGDLDAANDASLRAIPLLRRCGRISEAAAESFVYAHTLGERQEQHARARAVLDEAAAHIAGFSRGRAELAYFRAINAMHHGELGRALELLRESIAAGNRLAVPQHEALSLRASIESRLGRHEAALVSLAEALEAASGTPACYRADLLNNVGFQKLLAAQAGLGEASAAREPLEQALALHGSECHSVLHAASTWQNLAEVSLFLGELERAQTELSRAQELAPAGDRHVVAANLRVRGGLLLAQRRPAQALAVFEELARRSAYAGQPDASGELGRGRALRALGRGEEAVHALQAAEHALDEQMLRVSLDAGRARFASTQVESASLLVLTLLELGRTQEAFAAARHARARALRSLPGAGPLVEHADEAGGLRRAAALEAYWQARKSLEQLAERAWLVPADELEAAAAAESAQRTRLRALLDDAFPGSRGPAARAAPPAGTLWLGFFPLPEAHALFAMAGSEVRHAVLPASVARDELLAPFRELIAAAERVVVFTPAEGPLATAHDLPFAGEPLIAALPVAYALDLPQRPVRAGSGREVFVSDPRNDLPSARREGQWLAQHLPPAPRRTWLAGEQATHGAVVDVLRQAEHFHFAGHAVFAAEAIWESALLLHGRSRLTVTDVLALDRVPRSVVLAGCNTARAASTAFVASEGIAQAFVVRGASSVVATTEAVPDDVSFAFTRAYYESAGGPLEKHRQAVLTVRASGMAWRPFRVLVP